MKVLVTGEAGYNGSLRLIELLKAGHYVARLDSLVNGRSEAIRQIQLLMNKPVELKVVDKRTHKHNAIFATNPL